MTINNVSKETFLKASVIALSVALILGAISAYVYTTEVRHDRELNAQQQMHLLLQQKNEVILTFNAIASDLLFLAEHHELKSLISGNRGRNAGYLEGDLLHFSRNRAIYDQIRYMNTNGLEVVRINYDNGNPSVVPKSQLQNKGGRYYFADSMKLNRGEIFVSPLDLNVERGQIETPLKPTIRFGTPVFDDKGTKQGVMVLNFLAGEMLQRLKDSFSHAKGTPMLLNSGGYWLLAGNVQDEWGFMYKNDKTFEHRYPEAWSEIYAKESGHLTTSDGSFSFVTISPTRESWVSSTGAVEPYSPSEKPIEFKEYRWKAVALTSHDQLGGYAPRLAVYLLLTLIATILSGRYAIASEKRKEAEEESKRLVGELQKTLTDIKKLSGLLPICASCKKIRDDEGYWHQVETYIAEKSEAAFSHGYCPECYTKAKEEIEHFVKTNRKTTD